MLRETAPVEPTPEPTPTVEPTPEPTPTPTDTPPAEPVPTPEPDTVPDADQLSSIVDALGVIQTGVILLVIFVALLVGLYAVRSMLR